ncbi:MAG: MoaD/ThiS family protein [Pirellulales bacterium]|nr:MoaD/ThiS family protein [Pirellulales bacterium]
MIVTVKLFALARELAGRDELELEVADDATIADLRRALATSHPRLSTVLAHAHFAVDSQYATDCTPIHANSELALIPPVSGG